MLDFMRDRLEEDRLIRDRKLGEQWSRKTNREKAEEFLRDTAPHDLLTEKDLPRLAIAQVYATLALVDVAEAKGVEGV
jgi:hypothetical protein